MALIFASISMNIVFLFIILLSFVYLYFKYRYSYWAKKKIEYLIPTFPFGSVSEFVFKRKCIGLIYTDIYNYFKTKNLHFGGFYSIGQPVLMVCDPELIRTITTKEFSHFHDKDLYTDEENDPLTVNLLALKGLRWRNIRTKISPMFSSGKIKKMYQNFRKCSEELTKVVEKIAAKEEAIDIKDLLARFSIDIIGNCALGVECNTLANPNSEFRQSSKIFFEQMHRSFFIRLLLATNEKIFRLFKMKIFHPTITKFFLNLVQEIIEFREKNKVEKTDIMDMLIKLMNNESIDDKDNLEEQDTSKMKGISFAEVCAQVFLFFSAGFEPPSSTMAFCFHELATNQHIQDKLRNDIKQTLKKHNNELSFEALLDMTYLDKVIKETMRKYPISPAISRKCTKDFKLPNTDIIIEKDTGIIIPTLGIHRHPEHYPDPMKFDPERFNEEESAKRHQYAFIPFGHGPRTCVAKRFGVVQVKVGMAALIHNFKFTLHPKSASEEIELDNNSVLLNMKNTVWLQATKV